MSALRGRLLGTLPISRGSLLVRACERSDMDLLAAWPPYPPPHDMFVFSFAHLPAGEMDALYDDRRQQDDRITLVADSGPAGCIGYVALLEIDWERRTSHNLGIRVHPDWCGKGVGTAMLVAVKDWWFAGGMEGLRLDVASSNVRAVTCYEKVGFVKRGEFWKKDPGLVGVDASDPRWRFLNEHVRAGAHAPESRFLVMELTAAPR